MTNVPGIFGSDVFNESVMRERLPKTTYKQLKKTIEDGVPLDNRSTRAFSLKNNREIFRINHYCTKSLEDLRAKCAKGRAAAHTTLTGSSR